MDYEAPELRVVGTFSDLTLGMNGSSLDGQNMSQTGGGNDTDDPTPGTP